MALAGRILAEQGQGTTLSGQISCRANNATDDKLEVWTEVYGEPLELLRPNHFVRINSNLDVMEGSGFPNLATRFHLHVYRARPEMQCIIHTHAPWVSALSLTDRSLHVGNMDVMALYDGVAHLKTWPGVPFGDEEGAIITGVLGKDKWAAMLAHHGLIVGGRSIEEATYRAWFFEHGAKMQLRAQAATGDKPLPEVLQATAERAAKWRINKGPVDAYFSSWARQAIRNGNGDALIRTDDEATDVTSELKVKMRRHRLLRHPFLTCFRRAGFKDMKDAVRVFAENHYAYSRNFIRYLSIVADKVRPDLKHLLMENINEENGNYEEEDMAFMETQGIPREHYNKLPHRKLITRFMKKVDVDEGAFTRFDHPGGRFTKWIIDQYTRANACEALSMIGYAVEETVSALYDSIWEGLKKTDMDPRDYVFFPLHILVDDNHAELLHRGFMAYYTSDPLQCRRAPQLVQRVLDRRSQMMDEVMELLKRAGNGCQAEL